MIAQMSRESFAVSHDNLAASYSWPCQQARIKPARSATVSVAWPGEIRPALGLMPAGSISLLLISNLLDHRSLFKRSLSKEKKEIFASNSDMSIIVDLLLLGWLLQWIHPVSRSD